MVVVVNRESQLRLRPSQPLITSTVQIYQLLEERQLDRFPMIIPIRLPSQIAQREEKLPPVFATLSSNETMIIELQGSIEIEGEYEDQVIATLDASNLVSTPLIRT